jgi:hypothetical protein
MAEKKYRIFAYSSHRSLFIYSLSIKKSKRRPLLVDDPAECSLNNIGLSRAKNSKREVFSPENRVFSEKSGGIARPCFSAPSISRGKMHVSRREVFEKAVKTRLREKDYLRSNKKKQRGRIELCGTKNLFKSTNLARIEIERLSPLVFTIY